MIAKNNILLCLAVGIGISELIKLIAIDNMLFPYKSQKQKTKKAKENHQHSFHLNFLVEIRLLLRPIGDSVNLTLASIRNPPADAPTGVPNRKQDDGDDDGRKLERAEEDLPRAQLAAETLGRLGQTEDGSQVDHERGDGKGGDEGDEPVGPQLAAGAEDEDARQDDEHADGEDLVRQTAEQDVVGRGGILAVGLLDADEGGAGDLGDGGDDVAGDEDPEDDLGREHRVGASEPVDQGAQDGVDAGAHEDGGGDDEEVLQDEVDEVVRVLLGREQTRDVADDLEEEADGEGDEVPRAVHVDLCRVHQEEDEEEDDGQQGERKVGGVAVDDDGRVVLAAREREVGVDEAAASGAAAGAS